MIHLHDKAKMVLNFDPAYSFRTKNENFGLNKFTTISPVVPNKVIIKYFQALYIYLLGDYMYVCNCEKKIFLGVCTY